MTSISGMGFAATFFVAVQAVLADWRCGGLVATLCACAAEVEKTSPSIAALRITPDVFMVGPLFLASAPRVGSPMAWVQKRFIIPMRSRPLSMTMRPPGPARRHGASERRKRHVHAGFARP